MAGSNLRWARSPVAPKIVSVDGWTGRRSSPSASGLPGSDMRISSPVRGSCSRTTRVPRVSRSCGPPGQRLWRSGRRRACRRPRRRPLVGRVAGIATHLSFPPARRGRTMRGVHRIAFVAFDGFHLLDLAGPLEVAYTATLLGIDPGYETQVVTLDGGPARSASGVSVGADRSLAGCLAAGGARPPGPLPGR